MKRFLYSVLLISISVLTFNCQKEISSEENTTSGISTVPAPITATLQGMIVDENNQPASGVTIKVGSKTAITNAKGYFRIVKADLDKYAALVVAEKAGYFKAYRVFQASSGANHISIKLIKKSLSGTIASATGGDVTLANGSKITLPANGVIKATGGSYNGTINVYAAYIDPSAADIQQTVPGSFLGTDKNGNRVALTSFGMLTVELESTTGEKLQIASGKTATLNAPIPASRIATAPATIPLWYVDEQTSIWKEEGVATKNGNNYVGEVKHFSFWNCDIGVPAIYLAITLKNAAGLPFVHVPVVLIRPNGFRNWGYTDSLGVVCGFVPENETLQMEIYVECGTVIYNQIYNQNIGPFIANTVLPAITINALSVSPFTVQGTLLDCSGNPVTNGTAIVDFDYPRYVSTNTSGQFSVFIFTCGGNSGTVTVAGIDNSTQQQGSPVVIPVTSPITNAGNISACGTSIAQYINYTLDGTPYSIANAAPGSLYAYTTGQGPGPYYTLMTGYDPTVNKTIVIGVNYPTATATAATYPIDKLQVQHYATIQLPTPANINFSTFSITSGVYYEGNFAFSFKDSLSVTHTISADFRIKKY